MPNQRKLANTNGTALQIGEAMASSAVPMCGELPFWRAT